jgi:catechol 2,3-dioxygenase-like lactoylglutathione lyase family enzyme
MKRLATEVEHEVRRLAAKGHALREIRRMLGCCACHEPVPTLRDHREQRELAPRADVAHTDETDHGCDRPGWCPTLRSTAFLERPDRSRIEKRGSRAALTMAPIGGASPTGKEQGMKAHVSSILLGVRDMDRSKRFYTEGLGWEVQRDYGISVFFESDGGSPVGFYGRDGLAATTVRVRRAAASAGWSSPTSSAARSGSTRSWRKPSTPAPRSSSPPPPRNGADTAVPSPTRTATSGTSATAPGAKTSPMRSSCRWGEGADTRGWE